MQSNHHKLVECSGGEIVEGLFVKTPGIMITQTSCLSEEFKSLSEKMNLDLLRPEYEVHAELNSRITYMSFPKSKSSAELYNERMVKEFQHLSVYNDHHISILIAGISIEASQEIVSHNEASVARLTSSKTSAQSNPLFILGDFDVNNKKEFIEEMKLIREKYMINDHEGDNMLFPCSKAISIVATMSLKNWHKTLIGRLSGNGVEKEVQKIMNQICVLLHERYPLVILNPEEYYLLNNGKKYGIG